MSGTAAADFGGRKATATASGIVDGFVYLGSGVQSVGVGYLVTHHSWQWWPIFLMPFALIGGLSPGASGTNSPPRLVLILRLWNEEICGRFRKWGWRTDRERNRQILATTKTEQAGVFPARS